ncbi:MAG: hypothetical protein NZ937_03945 [Armatimonadetes bacterium]|nr:hypothetical protein [Armatimonadota bacterium]
MHFYDNYADSYKNHQVKAALEVNAYVQSVYEVYLCICPDKVHYPDIGRNDCYCYANKLKCDDCPAFRNYCPARTSTGARHPKCQCTDYRDCQPGNCSLCHAIRSRLGNVYNSPGYVQARGYGQVEFYVRLIVRRVIPGSSSLNNLTILLKRPKPKTGGDIDDEETAKPWKFEGNMPICWSAAWNVTKMMGKWEIWVTGQDERSAFKYFKIDKRAQVVITALSWEGGPRDTMLCNDFVGRVYNHVGINVNGSSVSAVWKSTKEYYAKDSNLAVVVFYRSPSQGTNTAWGDTDEQVDAGNAGHVAIRVGDGKVIDAHCLLDEYDQSKVHCHIEDVPSAEWPGNIPVVGDKKKDRTPPELVALDDENKDE